MEPIVCSLLLNVVSNIAYSYSEAFDYGGQYMVMAARILVGMSAGKVSVLNCVLCFTFLCCSTFRQCCSGEVLCGSSYYREGAYSSTHRSQCIPVYWLYNRTL